MLQTFMQKSYLSSLWAAAYILMDGCSDDTFDYFRGWLIAQGKETFEKVLDDIYVNASIAIDSKSSFCG